MAEVRDEAVAMRQDDAARGFWLDLRSKRDITAEHLTEETCGGYNYYDPLLSPKVGVVSVAPGVDWLDQTRPRSWALNLHSFRFADYWILHYLASGDASVLARLDEVVLDYLERIWPGKPDRTDSEFVYSDVSVAARASVMAFLIGREQAGAYRSAGTGRILRALEQHVAWASDDANYNSNNHGLFNDLHLLVALANFPDSGRLRELAPAVADRLLATCVERQVNAEGIHLEHTPAYALLWVLLVEKLQKILARLAEVAPWINAGRVAARLQSTYESVKRNLWWFVRPAGDLVNLGDQGRTFLPEWLGHLEGPHGTKLFPASGYAFYKSQDSYLALVAAYHATKRDRSGFRASSHKQRDELHVLWSEGNRDILIDTGLRAYDFGPERRYVISKQAHNTLSLHPGDYLTDGILDYMDPTTPYGGAVHLATECNRRSGWVVLAGEDPLLGSLGIRHWRVAFFRPGAWLVLCDLVRLGKGSKAEWNFHLPEGWHCAGYSQDGAKFMDDDERPLSISRYANTGRKSAMTFLHRGEFEPLRGWRFCGDPVAINNLRMVEWLGSGKVHLRATAFSLVAENDEVLSVDVRPAGANDVEAVLSLRESGSVRQETIRFEPGPGLSELLAGTMPRSGGN